MIGNLQRRKPRYTFTIDMLPIYHRCLPSILPSIRNQEFYHRYVINQHPLYTHFYTKRNKCTPSHPKMRSIQMNKAMKNKHEKIICLSTHKRINATKIVPPINLTQIDTLRTSNQ